MLDNLLLIWRSPHSSGTPHRVGLLKTLAHMLHTGNTAQHLYDIVHIQQQVTKAQ